MEKISRIVVVDLEPWQLRALLELAEERHCGIEEVINLAVREWIEARADYQLIPEMQLSLF